MEISGKSCDTTPCPGCDLRKINIENKKVDASKLQSEFNLSLKSVWKILRKMFSGYPTKVTR